MKNENLYVSYDAHSFYKTAANRLGYTETDFLTCNELAKIILDIDENILKLLQIFINDHVHRSNVSDEDEKARNGEPYDTEISGTYSMSSDKVNLARNNLKEAILIFRDENDFEK